mmetsp:Transcript_8948/g.18587  ORF Transcript_8948/g.18587 Transcript_8948/m.18587 type:complete len:290 (+) Transcript_8948:242-1111(+)|eukprot:CAMPEP_0197280348 /NCGR_PEP_ID=MMETSP1432-20130617/21379_1 /TAXON_ID=44447 /ORGANISM="Pseudo-nitzschia delicatissima, Strain UNC1205" /LENGTH=289 /DNA_ID=CAMNT_0042747023 /DNA_START=89 /DNA_END=955 /DNA_ORIENTATION=+
MIRTQSRITTLLLALLLGIETTAAYTPLTKLHLPRPHSDQRSSSFSNSNAFNRGRRRHRDDQPIGNSYWSSDLASSFPSDDEQNDDFDPPRINGAKDEDNTRLQKSGNDGSGAPSILQRMFDEIPFIHLFFPEGRKKIPPVQIDDFRVMLYDVFLIVNLSLSISFWVTHRLDITYIPYALNEGCLFSILWIASGLYHGSFLYSAMDGHFPLDDEQGRGGPKAAAALAFNTYINAINLRLVSALVGAWLEHRKVGEGSPMEDLIPLEIGCGIVLMTMWRALHSEVTPRVR